MSEAKNAEAELAKVICEAFEPRLIFDGQIQKLVSEILAAGYAKREECSQRRDIKDAPRDGRVIWAHIRADLPPRWPEHQDGSETSAWADRWAPIKHGGVHTYEDGHKLDMHWTIALPVGYGGITDDWFDDWTPSPKGQP